MDAVHDGAKVISMSIGYSAPSSAVRGALQYAEQHGVVLVASSGNSGEDDQLHSHGFAPVSFPAEYPGVLSVAAVNADGAVASFSSDNLSVQVAAPGVDIPAEGRDGQYWLVSGTSPACALVAGVAALIKSRYPGLSPVLVDQALTSTAHAGAGNGYNAKTGFGTVDATAALAAAANLASERPGKSPEATSAHFGGGPAAIPPAPVTPRSGRQIIVFSLLGLVAFGLIVGSGAWLAARRRRFTRTGGAPVPAGAYPAEDPAEQYPAPQYPAEQYPAPQYPARQYPSGRTRRGAILPGRSIRSRRIRPSAAIRPRRASSPTRASIAIRRRTRRGPTTPPAMIIPRRRRRRPGPTGRPSDPRGSGNAHRLRRPRA